MKILALETSAKSVSVAVTEDGVPLASSYQNTGLTHSRTLMPLLDAMLTSSGLELQDMDALAVAAGPGSFTGLRIGVSALKGLAWAAEKPCCGVSTLEAMARNLAHMDALIVCAMDARRNQVYNALFRARGGALERLTPDRAIGIEELAKELADISAETGKIVVGDGAQLCYTGLLERGVSCTLAPAALLMQNAVVIKADTFKEGDFVDVTGTSKGHGYQGVIKRWGAQRTPTSHGGGPVHRHAGSMGSTTDPSRIFKGKIGAGQMGVDQVTIQNLDIVKVDADLNLIAVRGAVPGPKGGLVLIKSTVKTHRVKHADSGISNNPQKASGRNPQKASARNK